MVFIKILKAIYIYFNIKMSTTQKKQETKTKSNVPVTQEENIVVEEAVVGNTDEADEADEADDDDNVDDDEDEDEDDGDDAEDDLGDRIPIDLSENEVYRGICTLFEDEEGNNILEYISLLHTELIGINKSLENLRGIRKELSRLADCAELMSKSALSDEKHKDKKSEKPKSK